jgi:hypothetical protein
MMATDKHTLPSKTFMEKTNCGNLYVSIISEKDGSFNRILAEMGKSGTCAKAQLCVICELLTGLLRSCTPSEINIILSSMCGHKCSGTGSDRTCSDVIARLLMDTKFKKQKLLFPS